MVDKVFADWQGNPKNEVPKLDTHRKIAPFGNTEVNKFTLTNIPPSESWDYESNLCYCYNCDLENNFLDIKLPKRTGHISPGGLPLFYFPPSPQRPAFSIYEPTPNCEPFYPSPSRVGASCNINQEKAPKITISVGITIPNHIGLEVNYKICFGNATCENGWISVFGNPGDLDKNLAISSENFNIQEDTVRMKLHTKSN